mgnify:CR=1 FL=1|tara:strand:+ start:143 stop:472 length:330 start_codon:yes stop_codon:yes gene_type:complete
MDWENTFPNKQREKIMISKKNFKKVVPQLMEQNKGGLDYEESSWDTFMGWKLKTRRIIKGEKGSSVRILMPVFYYNRMVLKINKNGESVPVIVEKGHHLFHISQTREVA